MKTTYNISIYHNDKETQLVLTQDAKAEQAIELGGAPYSIRCTGDACANIVEKLKTTLKDKSTPVTKSSIQDCLKAFDVVAVTASSEKLERALTRTQLLGRGMQKMSERQDETEARGRMMVTNPFVNLYMELKLHQDEAIFTRQKEVLFRCWKADKKSPLSLPEWESYKRQQWQANPEQDFLPWLYEKTWQQSNTTEDKLTWFLHQDHERFNVEMPFEAWKKLVISDITKLYGQHFEKGATEKEILDSWLEKQLSGSNLTDKAYVAFSQWKKDGASGDFEDEIIRQAWKKSGKQQTLPEYKQERREALKERWEKTGLKAAGMDFETWRKMQDPELFSNTGFRSFIHCDEKDRKRFQLTTSPTGEIQRNGQTFSTEYETTLHSGNGYAIFVVGPDETLYAASHIQQVFHHSSFLSNAATLAAGELRMGLDCVIQHAKDKQQVQSLLKQFSRENKDPYKIQMIKNEQDNTWTIAGENDAGILKVIDVPRDAPLGKVLQASTLEPLSFSTRSTLLHEAAHVLGRTNPTHQVTLLSSKSGHYQPQDEENYYMLKLWEKRGVDLAKTPFTSLGTSQIFRSAKDYLDAVASRMKARRETLVAIEDGAIRNPVGTSMTVVINKKGECYAGGMSHPAFFHPDRIEAKTLPGFEPGAFVSKKEIQAKIEALKAKVGKATAQLTALDELIRQTSPKMRAKRPGRLTMRANAQARIERMNKDIATLDEALRRPHEPGQQEIQGGGVLTLGEAGQVQQLDTKLGEHVLSPAEIVKTLLTLKRKAVNLDNLSLLIYDKETHVQTSYKASQFLIEQTKQSNRTPLSAASTAPESKATPASKTRFFKAALEEAKRSHSDSDSEAKEQETKGPAAPSN